MEKEKTCGIYKIIMEDVFPSNSTELSDNVFLNSEGIIIDESLSPFCEETVDLENIIGNENATDPILIKTIAASDDLQHIKKAFHQGLISAFKNDESDDIYEYIPSTIFEEYYDKYEINALEWLNELLISNLTKRFIVAGILKILYRMDYRWCKSFGTTMLMVTIFANNEKQNTEITDLIIQTIENWKDVNFKPILEQLPIKINYLEHYRDKVLTILS